MIGRPITSGHRCLEMTASMLDDCLQRIIADSQPGPPHQHNHYLTPPQYQGEGFGGRCGRDRREGHRPKESGEHSIARVPPVQKSGTPGMGDMAAHCHAHRARCRHGRFG